MVEMFAIRLTLHDNDYTQYLERICKNIYCYRYYDILKDIAKLEDKDLTKKEEQKNIKLFEKELFNIVLDELCNIRNDLKDFFKDELEIKLVKTIKCNWDNGETVYYILSNDKFLTF